MRTGTNVSKKLTFIYNISCIMCATCTCLCLFTIYSPCQLQNKCLVQNVLTLVQKTYLQQRHVSSDLWLRLLISQVPLRVSDIRYF